MEQLTPDRIDMFAACLRTLIADGEGKVRMVAGRDYGFAPLSFKKSMKDGKPYLEVEHSPYNCDIHTSNAGEPRQAYFTYKNSTLTYFVTLNGKEVVRTIFTLFPERV